MQKRWIGPPNPDPENDVQDAGHEVVVAGRRLGTVRHGEVLTVDDDVWAEIVRLHEDADCPLPEWPESLWEHVAVRPAAPRKQLEKAGGED